ncbi:MAG: hypothetical protein JWN27_1408 [Candidatus Eremiobacteraeota bacterium]|nr:hypothetical protein [Candidatus Eremiobacteraeota bacterium]
MTNANAAPDPIAAASAIVQAAAERAAHDATPYEDPRPIAPVIALVAGVLVSLVFMAAMVTSPATIPMWCLSHGGCP